MDKRPAPFTWVYFLFLLPLLVSCHVEKDPKVLEQHLADNPEVKKKYIYQSLLRLANVNKDPDFDKLIRDVRKITIYMPPSEDTTYQVTGLRSVMRTQGYEELVDFRSADSERISLWVNESFAKPHYLAMLDTPDDDFILEIDGQLNLEYLSALKMADQGSLRQLLN